MDDMEMDQELLAEFLTESRENLGDIEQQLLSLEETPDDMETINGIFRAIHTVKGTCGFLGLARLETLSHAAENLLGKIRSEKFPVTPDLVSLLLEAVDAIKTIIADLEESGAEPDTDYSALINRLKAATRAVEDMVSQGVAAEEETEEEKTTAKAPAKKAAKKEKVETPEKVEKAKTEAAKAEKTADTETKKSDAADAQDDEQAVTTSAKEKAEAYRPAAGKPQAAKPQSESSIRVDVEVVDELMNQVGELVLTRNRLLQLMAAGSTPEVQRIGHYIDHTTNRLQGQVLRLRMQPVAGLWSRVPRVVRDLSRELGKKIRVIMEGQETELDRFILAALRDPMTHIIRNSCDHGIEQPDVRKQAGKPDEGTIMLSARQESGNIIIEVSDDGKGIDPSGVRNKAVEMGVLSAEAAARMSDAAALQLIFHPGLSTAKEVSKVSGRGVGMDVVRAEIEKAGGNVEVESRIGRGTTLRMRIPLTLAIIPTLVVESGGQQFAVPQMSVQELLGVEDGDGAWEEYAGSHFYRLRGKLLPVMFLSDILGLGSSRPKDFTVIVIRSGQMSFGLGVNTVIGAEEIVVKPLGAHFQNLSVYAGCSILGDGSVVPILDCNGVMQAAQLDEVADAAVEAGAQAQGPIQRNMQHIVLFAQGSERYAIPMSLVQRLETVDAGKIERSADREVLQYRGEIIPFRRWGDLIGKSAEPATAGEMATIMLSNGERQLCLQVERIIDVAEVPLEVELGSERSFFLGTAVIHGQATEVVDVYELTKAVAPEWFGGQPAQKKERHAADLLLFEGSPFFRDLIMPTLEAMGFHVHMTGDLLQAKNLLEQQAPELILTDLDMCDQQGMDLARWAKKQDALKDVPIIALASFELRREEDEELFVDSLLKSEPTSLRKRLKEALRLKEVA